MRLIKIIALACLIFLLAAGCAGVTPPPASLSQDWGEQKTFDYHGLKINYYEKGQGPPVLLLHGFAACAYTWRFIGPPLAADQRVITMDLKGFGLSDKPDDGHYAMADQAEMVADFIRRQDLHDLVIMGHSMGGGVTLMTYLKLRETDPGGIKKLVLIDSAGYPQKMPWFIWMAKVPGLSTALSKLLPPRFAAALVLKKCYYDKDKVTEEQIDTYAYYGSLPGAAAAVSQTAKQIVPKDQEIEALIAQYKTIKVPVLVIWGKEDEVVPLKVGLNFKRDLPDSQLVVIPHCGHIPLEEEPLATRQAIGEFLKK
ncbi:MAG: alpha/beta hydrolase [Deltaproteobacteria bacterium]|nr:alpha/beta hydrolase [Deltaproteobacteria bacterium]